MDWFSKRKFVIVCHEKVVRIPLEGDEILRVHGERTQGVVKTLMNKKVDESKLSGISVFRPYSKSKEEHGIHLEVTVGVTEEGKRKCNGEAYHQDTLVQFGTFWEADKTTITLETCIGSHVWNSGDDQLRLRWMIYLVVLTDAAESVRDAIGFEYCLASSSGRTKLPVLWAEIGESSLTGLELVQEITDKVVLVKEKPKTTRDHQNSYVDYRRKPLVFEVGDCVLLKVTPWKGIVYFGKKGKLAPRYVGTVEDPCTGLVLVAYSSSSVPADYVSAGHVLVSADRDRIC
ncbi:hypothetical protein Tco_1204464 [Tanacetum coccineum]